MLLNVEYQMNLNKKKTKQKIHILLIMFTSIENIYFFGLNYKIFQVYINIFQNTDIYKIYNSLKYCIFLRFIIHIYIWPVQFFEIYCIL